METNDFKKLLIAAYDVAGYDMKDAETIARTATTLQNSVNDYYPRLTDGEIREAVRQGVLGMFGDYGALSAATFFGFIKKWYDMHHQGLTNQPQKTLPQTTYGYPEGFPRNDYELAELMFNTWLRSSEETRVLYDGQGAYNILVNYAQLDDPRKYMELAKKKVREQHAKKVSDYKSSLDFASWCRHVETDIDKEVYGIACRLAINSWFKQLEKNHQRPINVMSK